MTGKELERKPKRHLTDDSLVIEREKTDTELEKRSLHFEESADELVSEARDRADEIVTRTRERTDRSLRDVEAGPQEVNLLKEERRDEDASLEHERETADLKLQSEREARRRALSALLALERQQTNDHLLQERSQADEAIASRDHFLAMASHDLRNMLGGMAMAAESLIEIKCDEKVHEAILRDAKRIRRYTSRMARIVSDLVDVVSIDAGQLAVHPQRHDATELLRETVDVFLPIATGYGTSIEFEVAPGPLMALYDHERILQVLANLVGNALKFTSRGGRIHLGATQMGDTLQFEVSDTGCGIDSEKLESVFNRFWQAGGDRMHAGLGLGLYISKCIVEAHGGRIWAKSQIGAGSTFCFALPMAQQAS